jgi:hypothetical protein
MMRENTDTFLNVLRPHGPAANAHTVHPKLNERDDLPLNPGLLAF